MMTFVLNLWIKKIIGEKFSFSQENVNNKTIRNIYCYEHFCYHSSPTWFHMTWVYKIR
jgi:hypothetical protein